MTQETLTQVPPWTNHLHQVDGVWHMRLNKNSRGVAIPNDIARIVKAALRLEERRKSDKNMRSRAIHASINCHKTTFYSIGLIDRTYPGEKDFGEPLFPDADFKRYEEFSDLQRHLQASIGNTLWLVQIKSFPEHRKVEHSFLAGVDENGRIVCFEKEGAVAFPFRVVNLAFIYGEYREGCWAGGPITSISVHPEAENVRKLKAA